MSAHHQNLNTRRWEHTRLKVICRDGMACQECGRVHRTNQVDHKIPLHVDPGQDPYDVDNLQVLCVECHEAKTAKELGHAVTPVKGRDAWEKYLNQFNRERR